MKVSRVSLLVFFASALVAIAEKTPELPVPAGLNNSTYKSKPLPRVKVPVTAVSPLAAAASLSQPREMKLLVLAGDGLEPSYAAICHFLNYIGIPYDAVVAKTQDLPVLNSSTKGNYQGIVLATGALTINDAGAWKSALSDAEWAALDAYTSAYGVRTASFYTFPEPRYGLANLGEISSGFFAASFDPAAASVFPYLTRKPINVTQAWGYKAASAPAAGESTTPILMAEGAIVGAIHQKADGREYMALTFDHASHLMHTMALNYGVFNWVTKGIFIGARKIYMTPQVDDHFLPDDLYRGDVAPCASGGTAPCPTVRISGADLNNLAGWQSALNRKAQFKDFKVSHAFNGFGATAAGGAPRNDTLTSESSRLRSSFEWINHTWDHENLDCFGSDCHPATYMESFGEISQNIMLAILLRLPLDSSSMVTPAISGLTNPNFLRAARTLGIRYLVSDTSKAGHEPAAPNTGVRSTIESSILWVPRRPTNIYYNTSSGNAGVAGSLPDEYNYFYGPGGIFQPGPTRTYEEIINLESNQLLTYMMRYEIYPQMYHQSNLWRYTGTKSLFSDLIDATFTKFAEISNLPVISLKQSDLGKELESRMAVNAAKVRGTLTPGYSVVLTASGTASVPVTGVCSTGCESYGGQSISKISVKASKSLTMKVAAKVGR